MNKDPWLFSCIYASASKCTCFSLWDNLRTIKDDYKGKWLIGGDFNKILNKIGNKGGNPINTTHNMDF